MTCGAALTETLAEGVDYEKTFPLAGIDGPQRVELGAHRTRTLTLDKGRLTEREMTDSAAQDANAVPDGADENEETQA